MDPMAVTLAIVHESTVAQRTDSSIAIQALIASGQNGSTALRLIWYLVAALDFKSALGCIRKEVAEVLNIALQNSTNIAYVFSMRSQMTRCPVSTLQVYL